MGLDRIIAFHGQNMSKALYYQQHQSFSSAFQDTPNEIVQSLFFIIIIFYYFFSCSSLHSEQWHKNRQ